MSDQQTPETPPTAERPAWLPSKFRDAEQMAEAYEQLEARFTQGQQTPEPAPAPEAAPAAESTGSLQGIPEDAPAPEGDALWADDSLSRYHDSITQTGTLAPEDRQAFIDAGYPEAMIDNYVAGWQAQNREATAAVHGITGGEENYNSMLQWAKTNLPPGEQQAFNAAINGDLNTASAAVRGLYAQFTANSGNPMPNRGLPAGGAHGFESMEQMMAAQRDPRYKSDPAFRKSVLDRVQNSPNLR